MVVGAAFLEWDRRSDNAVRTPASHMTHESCAPTAGAEGNPPTSALRIFVVGGTPDPQEIRSKQRPTLLPTSLDRQNQHRRHRH